LESVAPLQLFVCASDLSEHRSPAFRRYAKQLFLASPTKGCSACFAEQVFRLKTCGHLGNLLRAADPQSGSVLPPYLLSAHQICPKIGVHFSVRCAKQVFPKVAAGFGSKNLLDEGS
jgi:hypothetical protein